MSRNGSRPHRRLVWIFVTVALAGALGLGGAWAWKQSVVRAAPVARGASIRTPNPGGLGVVLGRVDRDGVRVECRVIPASSAEPGAVREGQEVRFEFTIVETTGGSPLTRLSPSAWVVPHPEGTAPTTPREGARLAAALLQGSLFTPPEIDLNVFHVVTLNHNDTLSVVDPRFGFGGSKLLALVPLAARGDDWVLGPRGRQIFVAMPEANQVAVVDTQAWKVTANLPAGVRPHRIGLSPDGRHLWVAGGADGSDDSGVTALNPADGRLVARIRTGPGRHDLAFSDDSRFVFVTNSGEGTVSIIDAEDLREAATVSTGRRPYSVAYSTRGRLAYVTDVDDGTVVAVDPETRRVVTTIAVGSGLGQIRFSPDGRAGFAVNPVRNTVSVIDPTTNQVVQTTKVQEGPDQVTFTNEFAYIRHRGSVSVVMIALNTAGRAGLPLSVVEFPAGEGPPGAMDNPTRADSIVPAPGASAVLIANPSDRSVYYYKEGFSAPMGTFSNYNRSPRAALVVDRSLRERNRPGVYEASSRADRPGAFDVVLFLDQPRIVHTFPLEIRVDPERELARNRGKVDIQPLVLLPRAEVGQTFHPLFQLSDRSGGGLKSGLRDVEFSMYRIGGEWQDRRPAREIAPGVYGSAFRPDRPGIYHVVVACGSISLSANNSRPLTVQIVDPAEDRPPPGLRSGADESVHAESPDRNSPRNLPR